MCCRSEWQERMYIYKWHEVDQTKHEIFCSYCLQCNTSQSKFSNHYFLFLFAFSILSQLFLIWGCKWHRYHPLQIFFSVFSLSLSLSFHFFPITCSELTEQKQLNIVIYPSTNAPCLLLGNSIRLTQIIISSHLSLITLLFPHLFFPSFGSQASCQRVIQRGMDVSNHHILFRAVAFSETLRIIAASSKRKNNNVKGARSSRYFIFTWTFCGPGQQCVRILQSGWDKAVFFPLCIQQALVFLAIISSVCLSGCLSLRVMSVCGQECLYSKFWVCVSDFRNTKSSSPAVGPHKSSAVSTHTHTHTLSV